MYYYNRGYLCSYYRDPNECDEKQKDMEKFMTKCSQENKQFLNNIDLLSEAMIIYLKLEWNKAKNRYNWKSRSICKDK